MQVNANILGTAHSGHQGVLKLLPQSQRLPKGGKSALPKGVVSSKAAEFKCLMNPELSAVS